MIEFQEEGHLYIVDGVERPSVTTVLSAEGFIDSSHYDEYGRKRGEYVHKACALWDRNELDLTDMDPVILAYLQGWVNFLGENEFVIADIEQPLFRLGCCGTPDRVGMLNGTPTIVEIKTGHPESWAQIQTGGYAVLVGKPYDRFVVELTIEGKYKLHRHREWQDKNIFLSALTVHNWKKNHRR